MKILHVASFDGNIGDVLSHAGLYQLLLQDFGVPSDCIARRDMRRFYQNATDDRLTFDKACAADFNQHDLVILGGGGFLKQ